jgi:hypothetical protein
MSGKTIVEVAKTQLHKDNAKCGCYTDKSKKWCSEFVSWVYKEAGQPFTGGKDGWLLTDTDQICNWFRNRGCFVDRNDPDWDFLVPNPGDYVYIGRHGDFNRKHSGLVERVKGDDLHTIEGNNHKRPVDRYVYPNFRTNVKDNGPPKTDGIVLAFGLKSGRTLSGASDARVARMHFEAAMSNAFSRLMDPDLGLVRLVLQQMAAGLKLAARGLTPSFYFDIALRYAASRDSGAELGGIIYVLRRMAEGFSAGARAPSARTFFDAAAGLAGRRHFDSDLASIKAVLQQIASGLSIDARTAMAQVHFNNAVQIAGPSQPAHLTPIMLTLQQLAAGLGENLRMVTS